MTFMFNKINYQKNILKCINVKKIKLKLLNDKIDKINKSLFNYKCLFLKSQQNLYFYTFISYEYYTSIYMYIRLDVREYKYYSTHFLGRNNQVFFK